jgi:uncharacterized damage-inducible protein DinB
MGAERPGVVAADKVVKMDRQGMAFLPMAKRTYLPGPCGKRKPMKQHFQMFAAYNTWANARLYDAVGELSEDEFCRDVDAFFGSMQGTLNHVLAADRIWLHRFTGQGDLPAALDAVLFEKFNPLRIARGLEDKRICDWIAGLGDTALAGRFTYMTVTDMRTVSQRLSPALSHFFNHQTHHRGQSHTILSVLGKTPPPLDLAYFQRAPEGQMWA